MDSITQFVLGAAIGEVSAGKKAGNKALWWGGIAGTIPDLDVILKPAYTELEYLAVHRGFSHSLLFAFLTAPLIAWLVYRLHRRTTMASYRDWLLLFFLGIFTHPLLDAFTLYGTQLFLPFSNFRVAFNTISIVDPAYTLPLLVSCIVAVRCRRRRSLRSHAAARWGLWISTCYLGCTAMNKWYLEGIFDKNMKAQQIVPTHCMSNPVLFTNLLWCSVARDEKNCYIGYYSILQGNQHVKYEAFSIQDSLSAQVADQHGLDILRWFSKGYYVLEQQQDTLCFYDVRFGKSNLEPVKSYEKTFVFYFKIPDPRQRPLVIQQYLSRKDVDFGKFMRQLGQRIIHEE